MNTAGSLANITAIKKGNYRLKYLGAPKEAVLDYADYFDNLPDIEEIGLGRSRIQSPFKRFIYEVKKWLLP